MLGPFLRAWPGSSYRRRPRARGSRPQPELLRLRDHCAVEDEHGGLPFGPYRLHQRLHHPWPGPQGRLIGVGRPAVSPVEHHDPAPSRTHPRLDDRAEPGGVRDLGDGCRQVLLALDHQRRHDGNAGRRELGQVGLVRVPGEDLDRVQHPWDRACPSQQFPPAGSRSPTSIGRPRAPRTSRRPGRPRQPTGRRSRGP